MMRSLYAGVSGLQNHQYRTDVIGNNIANINTNGFKKNRVEFQDMLYQTLQGATKPTEIKGGINPKQVGLGATISSIDTLMSQGALQTTGKKTDLSIQGEGFFILKKGEEEFYSRAGNYMIDGDKNLVNSNGLKVQGWNVLEDENGNFSINNSRSYESIYVGMGEKQEAKKTSEIMYQCNLNSQVDSVVNPNQISSEEEKNGQVHYASIDIYDEQGKAHKLELKFIKIAMNEWQVEAKMPSAIEGSVHLDVGPLGNLDESDIAKNTIKIKFNDQGAIESLQELSANGDILNSDALSFNLSFNVDNGTFLNELPLGYKQDVKIQFGDAGTFNGITQLSSQTTTKAIHQDGYTLGYLNSFDINAEGILTAIYSNGQKKEIAQVALASFINPSGLEKLGDSNYRITNNSGIANVSSANSPGKGQIVAGTLEMSNVDLAEEFTNMIVAQRGFQANSKIITTSDQMLQELLTLKR